MDQRIQENHGALGTDRSRTEAYEAASSFDASAGGTSRTDGAGAGSGAEAATMEPRVAALEARAALADAGARDSGQEAGQGASESSATGADAGPSPEEAAARAAEEARIAALLSRTVEAHQVAAERGLGAVARIMTHAAEIAAILAWSPERIEDADRLAAATETKLAELRACLLSVYALRQDVHTLGGAISHPAPDLGECFGNATTRMVDLQRRVGGLIRLFETDVFNTVALEAVGRQVEEAYVAAAVANLGFSLARDRSEIVP